jgi:hypothetical protein
MRTARILSVKERPENSNKPSYRILQITKVCLPELLMSVVLRLSWRSAGVRCVRSGHSHCSDGL